MDPSFICPALLALTLCTVQVSAQTWDPVKRATGWAQVDKDGSIAFYDPDQTKIVSWTREAGVGGEVNLSGLPQALWYWEIAHGVNDDDVSGQAPQPEKWALDASFNAWVVTGRYLQCVGKDGKVANIKLPCEVGDLTWDAQGLYLSYRCAEPFIEKRRFEGGGVVWTYHGGTQNLRPVATVRHRIAVTGDKTLILSQPDSLGVELIDGVSGRRKGHVDFTAKARPAPARILGAQAAGTMAWWLDKNIVIQALPASQVPSLAMVGLLLAQEDLTTATVALVPTGLSEKHAFIGIVDSDAAFIAPSGGLVFVPIHSN